MSWRSDIPGISTVVDHAAGEASIPLFRRDGTHTWTVLDLADLPRVEHLRWYEARMKRVKYDQISRYAHADIGGRGQRSRIVSMHRLLMGSPQGAHVDHKDGDGLNNRRSNIRVATYSQNRANETKIRARKNGPFKGVQWQQSSCGWIAQIGVDQNRTKHLGTYDDPTSAALAYDQAAVEIYGEFASLNFTREQAALLVAGPRRVRPRGLQKHGAKGYQKWGCRCDVCTEAGLAVARAYRARLRSKAT